MTYWCEVRAWQQRIGHPQLVPIDEVSRFRGFRSVYAYPDDVADMIRKHGNTECLKGVTVYSRTLFLDFDNTDPYPTLLWLYDEGVGYEAYDSGHRSTHLHVHIVPMLGPLVPHSQKAFVAANFPGTDLTFYHQAGQFRLTHTVHSKTGRKKTFTGRLDGRPLEIPIVEPSARPPVADERAPGDTNTFYYSLLRSVHEPGRRVWAWHLARTAREAGMPFDLALREILWWNHNHCHPQLAEDIVHERVLEVYRRGG